MNGVVSRAKLKRESRTLSSKRGKRLCWKNSSKRLTIPKLIWCKWDTRLVRISSLLNSFDDSSHYQHRFANKGTTHFSLESDRAILCGVVKHGYGAWEKIREDMIHNNKSLLFQHTVQGMNCDAIAKRCDYRMRQMEKELEVREKKLSSMKLPAVVEAEVALDAIKSMEAWESEAKMLEMQGETPPPIASFVKTGLGTLSEYLKEKQACIDKLRETETQLRGCRLMADEAKISILQGESGINLSNITLKAGGPRAGLNKGSGFGVELEARINSAVLKIPECGDCKVRSTILLLKDHV